MMPTIDWMQTMHDYTEAIEDLATSRNIFDRACDGHGSASERYRGSVEAVAFLFDKKQEKVREDVEAKIIIDGIGE